MKRETVNIDITFWTMVVLFVKAAFAVIPAAIILTLFGTILVTTMPAVLQVITAMI
jgi:hypothetical protein